MSHVDALSRRHLPQVLLIGECRGGFTERIWRDQQSDPDVKRMSDLASSGGTSGFVMRGGLLCKELDDWLCLMVPKAMTTQIIRTAHDTGHFSVTKTEALLNCDYWIPGVQLKIEKIIKNCVPCILDERRHGKSEGYLCPLDKGEVPLDTYHIDHFGPLVSTGKNYKHVLVVVDSIPTIVKIFLQL